MSKIYEVLVRSINKPELIGYATFDDSGWASILWNGSMYGPTDYWQPIKRGIVELVDHV